MDIGMMIFGSSKHVIDIIMIFKQVNRNIFNTLELTLSSLKIRIIVIIDVTEPQKTNVNLSISGKNWIWKSITKIVAKICANANDI